MDGQRSWAQAEAAETWRDALTSAERDSLRARDQEVADAFDALD